MSSLLDDGLNGLSKPAAKAADDLPSLRAGIDDASLKDGDSFSGYARAQRSLVLLAGALTRTTVSQGLNDLGAETSGYLQAKESRGLVYTYAASRLDAAQWTETELSTFVGLQSNADRATSSFKALADLKTLRTYGELNGRPEVAEADRMAASFVAAAKQNVVITLGSDAWVQQTTKALDALNSLDNAEFELYNAKASELEASERRAASLYALLAVLGLVAAALAAFFVGRSLTRRLRKVTTDAHGIAVDQLPMVLESLRHPTPEALAGALPQLASDKNDEIGQLATDFNTILRTSIETSLEHSQRQANTMTNLLVNLGRRNQSLIDRQLELIDRLESSQQDPDLLEGLFKLDHMVTRQRRNAESLLILAGSKRSRSWSASVPLSDVIRGAVSEVADLNRVHYEAQPGNDMTLSGQHAVDLSHLLAELIENATLYSNPTTSVNVRVQRGPSHLRVWVIDSGVGMSEDDLIIANDVVKAPPLIEDIATDRVGFQVVGRLAQRCGVRVRLQNNPSGGVATSVDLPFSLFDILDQDQPVTPEAELAVRAAVEQEPSASIPMTFPDDLSIAIEPEPTPTPRPHRAAPAVPVMKFDASLIPTSHQTATQQPSEPGALPRRAVRSVEASPTAVPGLAPKIEPAPIVQPMTPAGLPRRSGLHNAFGPAGDSVIRRFPQAHQVAGDEADRRANMLKSFTKGVDAGRGDTTPTNGDVS